MMEVAWRLELEYSIKVHHELYLLVQIERIGIPFQIKTYEPLLYITIEILIAKLTVVIHTNDEIIIDLLINELLRLLLRK